MLFLPAGLSSRVTAQAHRRRARAPGPAGLALLAPWLVLLAVTLWPSTASAYAWMIRHGYAKCGSCHVDPSGGETLSSFGRVQSDVLLSSRWSDSPAPTGRAKLLYGLTEPEWLRLGGSIRTMTIAQLPKGSSKGNVRAFPMQLDFAYGQMRFGNLRFGGSLGLARVPVGSAHARAAQLTTDQGAGMNLISRSHWVGYDLSPEVLIRAGRLNLPFGVRIPEHVMWVRDATRTDRESDQQHGLAVSYSGGRLRGEVMGIAGNYQVHPDALRERGYSAFLEVLLASNLALGGSSLITYAKNDRLTPTISNFTRQAHGLMARYSPVTPLALLAEGDVLLTSATSTGYVAMLQADYELVQGLHLMLTGETKDQGTTPGAKAVRGSGRPALRGWASLAWFFFTHLDARVDFVLDPDAQPTLLSQIHFYY